MIDRVFTIKLTIKVPKTQGQVAFFVSKNDACPCGVLKKNYIWSENVLLKIQDELSFL
jgi:hypothetical protein